MNPMDELRQATMRRISHLTTGFVGTAAELEKALTPEEFVAQYGQGDYEIYDQAGLARFEADALQKGIAAGRPVADIQDEIAKAREGLVAKKVTDKNGKMTTKWVRPKKTTPEGRAKQHDVGTKQYHLERHKTYKRAAEESYQKAESETARMDEHHAAGTLTQKMKEEGLAARDQYYDEGDKYKQKARVHHQLAQKAGKG